MTGLQRRRTVLDALLAESAAIGAEIDAAMKAFEESGDATALRRWDDALAMQRGMSRAIRVYTEAVTG